MEEGIMFEQLKALKFGKTVKPKLFLTRRTR